MSDYLSLLNELRIKTFGEAIDEFVKNAEFATHRRLSKELRNHATKIGFSKEYTTLGKRIDPDVVMDKPGMEAVYIADAKVAKNEDPGKFTTLQRIAGYMIRLYALCRYGYRIGVFAIGTDNKQAASKWENSLEEIANLLAVLYGQASMNFKVTEENKTTYIVIGTLK